MENSLLYDLLEFQRIGKYRDYVEKNYHGVLPELIKTSREKLEKAFSAEQLKMIDGFVHYVLSREEEISILVDTKILYYGVQIGMQIQKAFNEDEF